MRTAVSVFLLSVVLTGCGTKVYDVQAYGPDQFVIYSKSKDAAEARSRSLEAANAHCAQMSKSMQPLKNQKVARRQFEFAFTCK